MLRITPRPPLSGLHKKTHKKRSISIILEKELQVRQMQTARANNCWWSFELEDNGKLEGLIANDGGKKRNRERRREGGKGALPLDETSPVWMNSRARFVRTSGRSMDERKGCCKSSFFLYKERSAPSDWTSIATPSPESEQKEPTRAPLNSSTRTTWASISRLSAPL